MIFRNKALLLGLSMLILLSMLALFAGFFAPYSPDLMDYRARMQGPSAQHLFGTDFFGRDIFSRTLYGTRIAFLVGMLSVSFAVVPGLVLGLLAGYKHGWPDVVIMHLMDGLLSFPALLLAIAVITVLGPGHFQATISIGIIFLPAFTRLIRGQVLALREEEYVQAAVALGASDWRIIFRHLLPNVMGPLIVQTTVSFANAILIEAGLSFLGLGTQPPLASWGAMLQEAKGFMDLQPWAAILPGLMIAFSVMGFNLFGDGLRDWLDPRFRPRLMK
ncbi:peptide ABC transporter permease [candidate division KSB3 bacterium]|uniref:Peptide ABC transporter permease n=1 Tax=candidate division KSB3 bacterium TaxID=2044937 RepID=A0A2G6E0X0_9BACT|nr:MAG: peptide ABC transporter permease [candidate division KSB3 bacterium]PIE28412.1 MAG: peptide ABC transporter permease [candidate division KSB3 bacterium]